jgi:hypothetical protein
MGTEYRIPLQRLTPELWDQRLRNAPYFSQFVAEHDLYEFRSPARPDLQDIPEAAVKIEPGGLYLCEYGSREVCAALRDHLHGLVTADGQPFVIEDYE